MTESRKCFRLVRIDFDCLGKLSDFDTNIENVITLNAQ